MSKVIKRPLVGQTNARHWYHAALPICAFIIITLLAVMIPAARIRATTYEATYGDDGTTITLTEPASSNAPGYTLKIPHTAFSITVMQGNQTVLKTTSGSPSALDFLAGSDTYKSVTSVKSVQWQNGVLVLILATTDSAYTVSACITPQSRQYRLQATVQGPQPASSITIHYDMPSSGHWYGHGETNTQAGGPNTDQAWPLDSSQVLDTNFGPSSYTMTEPFWFTQKGSGFYINTVKTMTISLGHYQQGVGGFAVNDTSLDTTIFVGRTARDVYFDYIVIAGKPTKSNATPIEYQKPLWNDYPEFYWQKSQAMMLDYAQKIHDAGIPSHTFQIDGGWGKGFTWNTQMFPDPKAMIQKIHSLGYKFGLWVTFWVNQTDPDYTYLAKQGYLLKSKTDSTQACKVNWFAGSGAGIVDLANPAARQWYEDQLNGLMTVYGVDGFKFDTQFFDDQCAPYQPGLIDTDYIRFGAELAGKYDQQGAGIRVHWTGSQKYGFVIRETDKATSFTSLQAAVKQMMAISTIGYPFVETDYIGGSLLKPLPTKQVLVRWAQAAALMPLMYSGISPLGALDVGGTGKWTTYDTQTVQLYKNSALLHGRLTPYILQQVQQAIATGEPIIRPLFFDFPNDQASYDLSDEWMLGPTVLAAPVLDESNARNVHLPIGNWYDVNRKSVIHGPVDLKNYNVSLDMMPTFVRLGMPSSNEAIQALSEKVFV